LFLIHVFVFYGSRFKVQRFRCTHAHLNIRRAAEAPACDGDGNAKANDKGKGKGKVTDHAAPLSMRRFKYATARANREK
jgi:hypothetical protein